MVKRVSQIVFLFLILVSSILSANEKIIDISNLKDINGQNLKLEAKSDKVFLYFWAYWCSDCEGKFTKFFPMSQGKIKIPIVTVNTDSKENKVRGFIEKHNITLPVLMDYDKSIRKLAAVNGVPGWALLKKQMDGRYLIVNSQTGFDESEVKKVLEIQ